MRSQTPLICVVFLSLLPTVKSSNMELCEENEEGEILESLMNGYNKDVLPNRLGVSVLVELHIQDIPSINELRSEFTLDILFSAQWVDPNLNYESKTECATNITLSLTYLKRIWGPNICIINSKYAKVHNSPSENIALILYQNGTVWVNYRMRILAPCNIDLRMFPFDSQSCSLLIESYSYHSQKVKLQWFSHNPVTFMNPQQELPDFTLADWFTETLSMDYPNGKWDELKLSFVFKRRFGFFVLQAFIPTYMTVFVAWISFFMDPKQISARATLGISSFLAMTLQFGNILKNQPRVSYIKALDVWMLAGITFMFATLAELAVISFMQRSQPPYTPSESPILNNHKFQNLSIIDNNVRSKNPGMVLSRKIFTPSQIDRWCMLTFPLLFLIFNVTYWFYYLSVMA